MSTAGRERLREAAVEFINSVFCDDDETPHGGTRGEYVERMVAVVERAHAHDRPSGSGGIYVKDNGDTVTVRLARPSEVDLPSGCICPGNGQFAVGCPVHDPVHAHDRPSGSGLRERVAEAIYDAMRENDPEGASKPWVPGGNSRKQDEARHRADHALDGSSDPEAVGLDVERLTDAMYSARQHGAIYDGITNKDEAAVYARFYDDPEAVGLDVEPQWEACKVCGGDHWTKDHNPLRDPTPRLTEAKPESPA
jgi:hypothetical protein